MHFFFYYNALSNSVDELKADPTALMTAQQSENWISWAEVMKVWQSLDDKVAVFSKREINS